MRYDQELLYPVQSLSAVRTDSIYLTKSENSEVVTTLKISLQSLFLKTNS